MMTIDNPTEAAAMQMMASRKLIVFVNKIVVRTGVDLPALSMIPNTRLVAQIVKALCYAFEHQAIGLLANLPIKSSQRAFVAKLVRHSHH